MDIAALTDADRVALLEQVYSSVEEVCSQLDEGDWDKPTDLPGWTVKDNLSHLVSYEAIISGRPRAPEDVDISHATHVTDDFQAVNEREVEWRRPRPGLEVLEEWREVTADRAKALAQMDAAAWETTMSSPFGPMPARDFVGIRLLDLFYHEQDIRRAVDKPGHLDGAVARTCFERLATLSAPRVVGKGAGAPDGATVVFDVASPGRRFAVGVEAGRGALIEPPSDPTVTIACDVETFLCLSGGRWQPSYALAAGRVTVTGDEQLGRKVLDAMSVIP